MPSWWILHLQFPRPIEFIVFFFFLSRIERSIMCGIVGYIGDKDASEIILLGLKRLEYRGYDSAGLAVIENGKIVVRREMGKLENLTKLVQQNPLSGTVGIGHTRWATHGEPSARNAHPHIGKTGRVVIVHNGIVENYLELRQELLQSGILFSSETDTETIVHLIEKYLKDSNDLDQAVRMAFQRLKGAHGIVVLSADEPDKIIAARIGNAGGVVIGLGEGEMFIASDVPALMGYTRRVIFLESMQIASIGKKSVHISTIAGEEIQPMIQTIAWDPVAAEKGEYRHFMQKEIHEQARSIIDTMAGRVNFEKNEITFPTLRTSSKQIKNIDRIFITACGTASYAGMVGKILIEKICRIPVEVDIASEFRYRDPLVDGNSLLIAISQSGETADTLAAMEEGKKKGALIWSIVNAIGSQAMRCADGYISMQTGPEIGVASTKAFTAPLVDLYMLAVHLAEVRGEIGDDVRNQFIADLRVLPDKIGKCLERENDVKRISNQLKETKDALYLGRGINMPIAYEGALKLKEISYIHAEAYPAGELKHGPIALIDKDLAVVALATRDPWYEKMISQIEQAKARGGYVIVVANDGDDRVKMLADAVLWVPEISWMLSPILNVIPLQLLAYHIATSRGLDVDQPRNLAKSVTVE
jgi:glucosamine--fructose-6-phosphate aminotransferase (isomerizing)